jgi:hypothetical protein
MDEINKLAEDINTTTNINEKVKMIHTMNTLIEKEKSELNNILENNIDDVKMKVSVKYKKMTLDELDIEFNKTTDIREKINIYHAIVRNITNITDDLFESD